MFCHEAASSKTHEELVMKGTRLSQSVTSSRGALQSRAGGILFVLDTDHYGAGMKLAVSHPS